MRPPIGGRAAPLAAVLVAAMTLSAATAGGESSGRDGVVVHFNSSISPKRLPRDRAAPVFITLSGSVHSSDGGPPPRLSRIELAFGSPGGLITAGLSRCPRRALRNATSGQAMARCGAALVGRGTILTEVPLAPARPLQARADLLAFNGVAGGRPAVWVLAYSESPPLSFVLPFYLRRLRTGAYGVLVHAPVSQTLGRWPRLRSFQITLGRRYHVGEVSRSYLNARCPLPPRFHSLSLPLARATYEFDPVPNLAMTIFRACRIRA